MNSLHPVVQAALTGIRVAGYGYSGRYNPEDSIYKLWVGRKADRIQVVIITPVLTGAQRIEALAALAVKVGKRIKVETNERDTRFLVEVQNDALKGVDLYESTDAAGDPITIAETTASPLWKAAPGDRNV